MTDRITSSVGKRDAAAAQLDTLGDGKRARRTAGNEATLDRAGSPDYSADMPDDEFLKLLRGDPLLARLIDSPGTAGARDMVSNTSSQSASVASDEDYGSLPDLSSYQLEALEKGLPIEIDGYPVSDNRNLQNAAFEGQSEPLGSDVEWNTAKLQELKGELTKAAADSYAAAAYARAGVEYNRYEGVAPIEDRKLVGHLKAYKLSVEYQDRLMETFCAAANTGQVFQPKPPPQSIQRGLFDDADDEFLIVGRPDEETGQCLLYTERQYTEKFNRKIEKKAGESINVMLDNKMFLFGSLDGKGSLQPMPEFARANDRASVEKRLKRHNVSVSVVPVEPGKSVLDGAYYPPLLVRTFKNNDEPKFTAMWPHREQMGSLTDLIDKYKEENIWLKTGDNIYKNPVEYNLSEQDSAHRTFAQMSRQPVAWVRAGDDFYVDVNTFRTQQRMVERMLHGMAEDEELDGLVLSRDTSRMQYRMAEDKELDALVLSRDGGALVTPAKLKQIEHETYEETMHMVGLSPALAELPSKPASASMAIDVGDHCFVPARSQDGSLSGDFVRHRVETQHASVTDDSAGSPSRSDRNSLVPAVDSPATSAPAKEPDPRAGERQRARNRE